MTARWVTCLALTASTTARADPAAAPVPADVLSALNAGMPARTHAGGPLVWRLASDSRVMPDLAVYVASDVYPICAVWDGRAAARIAVPSDARQFNALVDRTGATVASAADAADLATLFVIARACPYLPRGLTAKASAADTVELVYERTVPWSPARAPDARAAIAGAMTTRDTVRVRIVDHRHVKIEGERSVPQRHSP